MRTFATIARRAAVTGMAAAALTAALGTGVAHAAPQTSGCLFTSKATTTITYHGATTTRTMLNTNGCIAEFDSPKTLKFLGYGELGDPADLHNRIYSMPALVMSKAQADGRFHVELRGELHISPGNPFTSTPTAANQVGFDVVSDGQYVLHEVVRDAAGRVADTTVTFKKSTITVGK